MAFGMTKAMPGRMVPKVGEDADTSKRTPNNGTTPKMPDRDGPARMSATGANSPKKPTSAKAKGAPNKKTMAAMKNSLKAMS